MSDYQKAKILHDYLIQHAQYDITLNLPYTHSPEGVLLHGKGVCQSYAEAYQLLLNGVNIPNALEYGDDHVWNMVYLTDKYGNADWTHVDCTWDDPTNNDDFEESPRSGRERSVFFGLTNKALEGVDQHECTEKPHIATNYNLNYTYDKGGLDSRINELLQTVNNGINSDQLSFVFTPDTFEVLNKQYGEYCINERVSIEIVNDMLTQNPPVVDGITYDVELSYSPTSTNGTVTVTATPTSGKESYTYPPFTLSPADSFALTGALSVEADGVAQLINNVISFTGAGEATVVAEYDDVINVYTINVRELDTITITAETIEEEAFSGTGAERIVVASSVRTIGADAFLGCSRLLVLRFEGAAEVDSTVFMFGENEAITVLAPAGSPAADWMTGYDYRFFPID